MRAGRQKAAPVILIVIPIKTTPRGNQQCLPILSHITTF
jgi:hypothetical protein